MEIAPGVTIIKRKKIAATPTPAPAPAKPVVRKNNCVVETCNELCRFGYELKKPICCKHHTAECAELHDGWEPFNVYDKYCDECLIEALATKTKPKHAKFSVGGGRANRCGKHRGDGVDVSSPMCIGPDGKGCEFKAVAFYGYGTAEWCSKCKPDDEVVYNVTAPHCACGKIATFGIGKKLSHCKRCALQSNTVHGTTYAYL